MSATPCGRRKRGASRACRRSSTPKYDRIEALEPDLILGFSDLQANIAAELIKRGYPVMVFNQRSVAEILQMIRILGALIGCPERRSLLVSHLELEIDSIRAAAARCPAGRVCSSRNGTTR